MRFGRRREYDLLAIFSRRALADDEAMIFFDDAEA